VGCESQTRNDGVRNQVIKVMRMLRRREDREAEAEMKPTQKPTQRKTWSSPVPQDVGGAPNLTVKALLDE